MTYIPHNIDINDYDYPLPSERIARYPLPERDASMLLFFDGKYIEKKGFADLPELLDSKDFLVFNNTKVIHARLRFVKSTGAEIEIFCLEPLLPSDYQLSLSSVNSCVWKVMVGNLRRWKSEMLHQTADIDGKRCNIEVRYRNPLNNMAHEVEFAWDNSDITFAQILAHLGELPIPPYLNRKTESADSLTYQTTYSKVLGSVAAPTAGLHFTDRILQRLTSKGIGSTEITLHIGAGTFQPVKTDNIAEHQMHTEVFAVGLSSLELIADNIDSIVAVGTTSVRTLESLYYIGCHISKNEPSPVFEVSQWEAYENNGCEMSPRKSIETIIKYMIDNKLDFIVAKTQIMIVPGFKFRIVNKLITNFHQPRSTLLLLVSAFVGDDNRRKIYDFALGHNFRFLSYGDSSLLTNNSTQ